MADESTFLRQQAAKCRELAQSVSGNAGKELIRLAEDFEARAAARDEAPGEEARPPKPGKPI